MMSRILMCIAGAALLTGCSLKLGAGVDPPRLQWEGPGAAYICLCGIRPYDGDIIEAHIFGGNPDRPGEVLSLDVWPLAGIGIGVIGARLQILWLEAAAGIFFHHPKPVARGKPGPDVDVNIEAHAGHRLPGA